MSKKTSSSFCNACCESESKMCSYHASESDKVTQKKATQKKFQFNQIPQSAEFQQAQQQNIAYKVLKKLKQQNFNTNNTNEFKTHQKLKERKSTQQFYDYILACYNTLNINGKQTRTSGQWKTYYMSLIQVFNQKLFYMYSDINYVPYLNKIKDDLVKKRNYFNRVMGNPKAKQELPDARIALYIRRFLLPPLEQLLSYVGGSSKPVSQIIYSTQGWIYYQGGIKKPV